MKQARVWSTAPAHNYWCAVFVNCLDCQQLTVHNQLTINLPVVIDEEAER